nr:MULTISPECIES: adenosylcobinamide-GDP ribazoletransferase [unclassified Paenibacillus]
MALWITWGSACAAAFQFLTRLPVPVKLDYNDALFRRSVVFYPLVGFVLGALLFGVSKLLNMTLPPLPAAALLLAAWTLLTGALHLDGLMDTADGILSHRSRERMLEIMKDSRVGAMGVMVCVLVMLLKWSLLQELLRFEEQSGLLLLPMVLLWSRWYMVVAIAGWPYARQEQGGGMGTFYRGIGWKRVAANSTVAVLLSAAVLQIAQAFGLHLAGGIWLILAFGGMTLLSGYLMSAYIHSKLGGLTGDTYGAMNELLEVLLLFMLVLMIGWGE